MRAEIRRLVELGELPSEDDGDVETLRKYEIEYRGITRPITDEEAIALLGLFGEDGCFGFASSLMHLIETAPGWPIEACLTDTGKRLLSKILGESSAPATKLKKAKAVAIGFVDGDLELIWQS